MNLLRIRSFWPKTAPKIFFCQKLWLDFVNCLIFFKTSKRYVIFMKTID